MYVWIILAFSRWRIVDNVWNTLVVVGGGVSVCLVVSDIHVSCVCKGSQELESFLSPSAECFHGQRCHVVGLVVDVFGAFGVGCGDAWCCGCRIGSHEFLFHGGGNCDIHIFEVCGCWDSEVCTHFRISGDVYRW